jgi:hypothetical protein
MSRRHCGYDYDGRNDGSFCVCVASLKDYKNLRKELCRTSRNKCRILSWLQNGRREVISLMVMLDGAKDPRGPDQKERQETGRTSIYDLDTKRISHDQQGSWRRDVYNPSIGTTFAAVHVRAFTADRVVCGTSIVAGCSQVSRLLEGMKAITTERDLVAP